MKKLLVVLSLMISTNSFAGILLEPYVGYHFGKSSQTGGTDADVKGMGYGGRLGWTLPLVFIAADYSIGNVTLDQDVGASLDADYKALGLVVGASLPAIRIWAGYNFNATVDVKNFGKYEGSGMKVGLGFKMPMLPISFNLEYLMDSYDEFDGTSLTHDLKHKGVFLSVSAPFNF